MMPGYREDIMDATGASQQEAQLVEGLMREDNRGILSDLTERQFDAQARAAYAVAQELLANEQYREVVNYYRGRA